MGVCHLSNGELTHRHNYQNKSSKHVSLIYTVNTTNKTQSENTNNKRKKINLAA